MTVWEQTPGAILRNGAVRPAALATVPGPDARPRADQYPDAAAEYRTAWESRQWAYQAADGSTQLTDNAGVRDEMRRLAADGWQGAWLDFPELGLPPRELLGLYAAARAAQTTRVGTATPGAGADRQFEQMLAESDYAKTPWALTPSGGRVQ